MTWKDEKLRIWRAAKEAGLTLRGLSTQRELKTVKLADKQKLEQWIEYAKLRPNVLPTWQEVKQMDFKVLRKKFIKRKSYMKEIALREELKQVDPEIKVKKRSIKAYKKALKKPFYYDQGLYPSDSTAQIVLKKSRAGNVKGAFFTEFADQPKQGFREIGENMFGKPHPFKQPKQVSIDVIAKVGRFVRDAVPGSSITLDWEGKAALASTIQDLTRPVIITFGNSESGVVYAPKRHQENLQQFLTDALINSPESGLSTIQQEDLMGTTPGSYDSESVIAPFFVSPTVTLTFFKTGKNDHRSGFFPFYHNLDYSLGKTLKKLAIYNQEEAANKDNYKLNCLETAIANSNLSNKEEIAAQARSFIKARYIARRDLEPIALLFDIKIKLTVLNDDFTFSQNIVYNKESEGEELHIACAHKHYFLVCDTEFTRYSIRNYSSLVNQPRWNEVWKADGDKLKRSKDHFIDSIQLLKEIYVAGLFTPIDYATLIATPYHHNEEAEITYLEGKGEAWESKERKQTFGGEGFHVCFYDIETIIGEEKHIPFLIRSCLIRREELSDPKFRVSENMIRRFEGLNCAKDFLNSLPKKGKVLLYAHNAGYDWLALKDHIRIQSVTMVGGSLKQAKFTYFGTKCILRDSYSLITKPLRGFSSMFNLPASKGTCPFSIYTRDSIKEDTYNLEEARKELILQYGKRDREVQLKLAENGSLNEIIEEIAEMDSVKDALLDFDESVQEFMTEDQQSRASGEDFYHMEFASHYCGLDVLILANGFLTFREWNLTAFNVDVFNIVTTPSLSEVVMEKAGCFEGVVKPPAHVRDFIMQAMVGGRVMTRDNVMWHTKVPIADLDANSLYPSAFIEEGGFLIGNHKVLEPSHLNMEFLNSVDGYFVEINVTDVGKELHFPILTRKSQTGNREFSNEIRGRIVVDKCTLEDLIEFQQIKFEIVRGIFYDEGRNQASVKLFKELYTLRKKYKSEGNSIEQVYKLMLNAGYGKLIQKPIKTKTYYVQSRVELDKYISKHANVVKRYFHVGGEDTERGDFRQYCVESYRDIVVGQLNYSHLGVEILSYSKRIMNQVMCLAEEIEARIFYQDTDSMHIERSAISTLEKAYFDRYGKVLIGSDLGQFSSDFEVSGADPSFDIFAEESLFLGKKCYIDKLRYRRNNGAEDVSFHARLKGIPSQLIKSSADPMGLYHQMYSGGVEFDLTYSCPIIRVGKFDKRSRLTEDDAFTRMISFEGDLNVVN